MIKSVSRILLLVNNSNNCRVTERIVKNCTKETSSYWNRNEQNTRRQKEQMKLRWIPCCIIWNIVKDTISLSSFKQFLKNKIFCISYFSNNWIYHSFNISSHKIWSIVPKWKYVITVMTNGNSPSQLLLPPGSYYFGNTSHNKAHDDTNSYGSVNWKVCGWYIEHEMRSHVMDPLRVWVSQKQLNWLKERFLPRFYSKSCRLCYP